MLKNSNEKIDVAIITLNAEKYIEQCLKSVREHIPVQNLIVVDGGSTDRTIEIAKKYNTKIIRDLGTIGSAVYLAAENTTGEWFVLSASDVTVFPEYWENICMHLAEKNVGLINCFGGHPKDTISRVKPIAPSFYNQYLKDKMIFQSSYAGALLTIRRKAILGCKELLKAHHLWEITLEDYMQRQGWFAITIYKPLFFNPADGTIPLRAYRAGRCKKFEKGFSGKVLFEILTYIPWVIKDWLYLCKYKKSLWYAIDLRLPIYLVYLYLWYLIGYLREKKYLKEESVF